MRNTHTKAARASSKLWMLPLVASLAGLFAFTGRTPGRSIQPTNGLTIAKDTPRIKYFSKLDIKKTTGDIKGIVFNDVKVYVINGRRYVANELLYKYNEATLRADEMIVLPVNDENAVEMYGASAMKGVIIFKGATIIPPMIDAKNKPLFLIDGVEQTDIQSIKSFDPNNLKGISVLRDSPAMKEKYGEKAKYGMVEILTWNNDKDIMIEGVKDEGTIMPPVDESKGVVEPMSDDPDKIWERVEIDANFKGGSAAWRKYLERNLDEKAPKKNGAPAATYTAWLQFVVEKDGTITDIKVLSAHGFSIETEAMRVIRKSDGMWVPAIQNGRYVRAIKKQAITFVVD